MIQNANNFWPIRRGYTPNIYSVYRDVIGVAKEKTYYILLLEFLFTKISKQNCTNGMAA
jgi:hypothetical protein